jgi:hypothetical protein
MLKPLLIFLIILALPACTVFQSKEAVWPDDLPPRAYFLNVYQQDAANSHLQNLDQYMLWVIRFYQGSDLYPNGWNSITQTLLEKIREPETIQQVKDKMDRVGLLISGEWAKNNQTRLINTRHVSIWGNALFKSLEQGETLELIERVSSDVDDLLTQRIPSEAITEGRFYAEEDIFEYLN